MFCGTFGDPFETLTFYFGPFGSRSSLFQPRQRFPYVFQAGGYHKMPYMMASAITGSIALLVIGIAPHSVLPVTGRLDSVTGLRCWGSKPTYEG